MNDAIYNVNIFDECLGGKDDTDGGFLTNGSLWLICRIFYANS